MKNKSAIKVLCWALVIIITVLTHYHSRERLYFPKFGYEHNERGLIIRDSLKNKNCTVSLVPKIIVFPVNNNVVINNIQMRYLMPNPQSPNIGISRNLILRNNYLDDLFIKNCILTSVQLGEMLTRIPFVLEVEYIKYNGKKTFKQAYVFEYIQYYNEFKCIGFVGKISLNKSRNEDFLKDLYNGFVTQSTTFPERRKGGDVYTSSNEHYIFIDSTFSFNYYEE